MSVNVTTGDGRVFNVDNGMNAAELWETVTRSPVDPQVSSGPWSSVTINKPGGRVILIPIATITSLEDV